MRRSIAVLVLALSLLLPARDDAQEAPQPAQPVSVAAATTADWPAIVSIPGTVSAVDTANLASRAGGWVTDVKVDAGARVTKGEILAEVGVADLRSQVAQAQGRLSTAQATFTQAAAEEKRYRTLHAQQFASAEQYETMLRNLLAAKAELDAATSALATARHDLDYAEIRAPFAGIVATKNIWPGDYAAPGATLFVIAGDTPEIRAQAGAATFAALTVGDPAEVVIDGKPQPATVTRLVAAADAQTRTHLVELNLQGPAPFGAYAEVRLSLGRHPALTIPDAALIRRAGLLSVFVVGPDHRARIRLVRAGERRAGQVAIVAGLAAGETVVVAPSPDLENGSLVAPEPVLGGAAHD